MTRLRKGLPAWALLLGTLLGCGSRNDLPLIEVPATGPPRNVLAVILSGDGGWARIDREISEILAERGIRSIGFDSLRYFWNARSEEEVSHVLQRILEAELASSTERVVVIGFSRGANTAPFVVDGLSPELRARVELVALLSPTVYTDFEFRLRDWFGTHRYPDSVELQPAVERLPPTPTLCIFGTDDSSALCPHLPEGLVEQIALPGGHHFDDEFRRVTELILARIPGV